jgi:diguanylate cyclase (GGDEF)-like protein
MDKIKKTIAELRQKARETAPTRWSRRELAQMSLLKGAHQETIAPILRDCPVRVLANGDDLLRAGEACNAVYMVLSGRLAITDPGVLTPRAYIKPGDSIGEMILRERIVAASAIRAVEPSRVLVVHRDVAWELVRKSHEASQNWLAVLAGRSPPSVDIGGGSDSTAPRAPVLHDELTGLYNRRWLEGVLPRQIARSSTGIESLALLLIEIDGFTDYTGRFGHNTADLAYQAVAQTVVLSVRPTDFVVSYGPGQFAAVLPRSDAVGACLVGERIRGAISKAGTLAPEDNLLHSLTISVGAIEMKPYADAAALLAAAEAALTLARRAGGDRVATL